MPHPLSQTLLKSPGQTSFAAGFASTLGGGAESASQPERSFSQALEQRIGTGERAPENRPRQAEPERERPSEPTRQTQARHEPEPTRERPSQKSSDGRTAERRTDEATGNTTESTGSRSAEASAASADSQRSDPAQPDPADPAAAAAVAALLPNVAASQGELAGPGADAGIEEGLLGKGPNDSAASALERLLGDMARRKAHPGKAAGGYGEIAAQAGAGPQAKANAGELAALAAAGGARADALKGMAAAQLAPELPLTGVSTHLPSGRAEQAQLPQLPVPTPAGQRAWAEDVGNRVMWMVGRNDAKAELTLTPAHLGKLEVSIQIEAGQTTAHFVAATAAARDALEQAMPRLREVLEQAGINLGQANVSTSSEQQARQGSGEHGARAARGLPQGGDAGDAVPAATPPASWSRTGTGMVDTFA